MFVVPVVVIIIVIVIAFLLLPQYKLMLIKNYAGLPLWLIGLMPGSLA